jgi:hypothetical protein
MSFQGPLACLPGPRLLSSAVAATGGPVIARPRAEHGGTIPREPWRYLHASCNAHAATDMRTISTVVWLQQALCCCCCAAAHQPGSAGNHTWIAAQNLNNENSRQSIACWSELRSSQCIMPDSGPRMPPQLMPHWGRILHVL